MGKVVTPQWFKAQMKRLLGLKFAPLNLDTHWEGLSDLSEDDVARAVAVAVRDCDAFPSPAALRDIAVRTRSRVGLDDDRSTPLAKPIEFTLPQLSKPITASRVWNYYCDRCSDTGWQSLWCGSTPRYDWLASRRCERQHEHGEHEYTVHCVCWDTNPAVIKKRDRSAQQASQRTAKQAKDA